MTWWKLLIAGVLLLGSAGITVAGLRERPPPPVEVQFANARRSSITRTVTGAGKVQAATTVKISSNLSGDLTELLVREGDRVDRGRVLGRIDRKRFEAAARQGLAAQSAARAEMQLAQVDVDRTGAELARVEGLSNKGLASAAEVERARADRDAAVARLASARERHAQAAAAHEEAQTALAKTTLSSPIEGTVIEVSREVGERVRGSDFSEDVVMTIASLSAMEMRIEVGEHEVVHLKPGLKADVKIDALEGQSFEGTVVEIAQKALIKSPGTEQEVTTFPVTVALAARPPGVLPGMSGEVRIAAETRESAVVVPVQAVTVRPEKSLPDAAGSAEAKTSIAVPRKAESLAKVVFVVDPELRAHVRRVRTGISSDTDVEVIEGLSEGERVVEGPYRTLAKDIKDGDRIEEVKPGQKKRRKG
ncbi:MAG: efflux RND transporter periplasmic adaptor subunit [Myxococcales bacterium]|nr:efflux RND transporter periplasmic adaptor subunit [Myxococcales bacterium]